MKVLRTQLFILIFMLSSNLLISQDLEIQVHFDSINEIYQNEYLLCGKLTIDNNTTMELTFPKTFDLEISIFDEDNQRLESNPDISVEYFNLVNCEFNLKIPSQGSFTFDICEWRLFLFDLKEGKEYFLQYLLDTGNYDHLKHDLKEKKISSNRDKFTYDVAAKR